VVCKELPLGGLDAGHLQQLQNEVRILSSLQHDHIIAYRSSFPRPSEQLLCVVMEYAEGGTLHDVVSAHSFRNEPIAQASSHDGSKP
jgi:serine/threonine protein kinase